MGKGKAENSLWNHWQASFFCSILNLERFEIITEEDDSVSGWCQDVAPSGTPGHPAGPNLLSYVIFIVNTIIMLTGLPKLYKLYTLLIGQP